MTVFLETDVFTVSSALQIKVVTCSVDMDTHGMPSLAELQIGLTFECGQSFQR